MTGAGGDTATPVVMRGAMASWPSLSWTWEDWLRAIKVDQVKVRLGERSAKMNHPQWERFTKIVQISPAEFFCPESRGRLIGDGRWGYLDYQYMHQIIREDILGEFSWASLGHPGTDGTDSTVWAGTEGATTPCHQDTYGENLVCQAGPVKVEGTKRWTLFSPADTPRLKATRVPYEESSVYSMINFSQLERNSQTVLEGLRGLECFTVELHPGDVLYVPRHWWHQVSTLSPWSVSVNTWLPHPADTTARLGEALVRWHTMAIIRHLNTDTRRLILNPNEDDLVDSDLEEISELIKQAKRQVTSEKVSESEYFSYKYEGEAEKIVPTPLVPPASSVTADNSGESLYSSPVVKVLNSVTSQTAIAEAVRNILSSDL